MNLFVLDLSFIGWFVLCVLTLGLLFAFVVPYYFYARTMFLKQIYEEKRGVPSEGDDAGYEFQEVKKEPETEAGSVCKYCGAELPEGASFCGMCGKQQ